MNLTMMKSKIHRATVTEADLNYEGSIAIDPELLRQANMLEFERVDIYNCNNGERFSTYTIKGEPGQICLNGAAARKALPDDEIIIVAYASMGEPEARGYKSTVVLLGKGNAVKEIKNPVV